MAKYSFKFKKNVVKAYLDGQGGYKFLAKNFGVTNESIVRRWVHAYKILGDDGLLRSREKKNYSFEEKLRVVELYLSSELSYQELARQEKIVNPSMIANWVGRFRIAGPDALRPRKKGRKKTMNSSKKPLQKDNIQPSSKDISNERVKELEDELLKLRIENAFLKEMRRLRLEDEAKMRERRSSSTVSDENSN